MTSYKQEMPPPGGYSPLDFSRKMPRGTLNGLVTLGCLYATTFVGIQIYHYRKEKAAVVEREDQENRIALTPFILAEQQRLYMKQLRRNRDYEKELMKDVANWKVGHWFDYPVFHNPRGLWCDPYKEDFYAHLTQWDKGKQESIKRIYP
ncbi:unnamed protein product [Trichobilharzia szidati]|nr:unnamed protein product [Trichobilharzia szidati]